MEDPHLVQLARERGFISEAQIAQAQAEQTSLSERGIERSLWFLIQDFGFVSDQQSRELRRYISSSRVRALEVDGYVIQGRLGSGGMGDVFRGRNAANDEVAIKLLATRYSNHEEYAKRFQREAKATLRLSHPHITRSISAGLIEAQRYLIMELVPGKSLKERIVSGGPLSEKEGLTFLTQMALALRYAWRRGVLHRDVKPANIILAPPRDGVNEPFCAKLCDFGLAKTWQVAGEETASMTRGQLTHSGVALGTPHYMSPEQASGEQDLDQRTDIYGLGATLFHAVLGQTLYTGKSSAAIMYKQVTEAVDLSPLKDQKFSGPFISLCESMLTKERARRARDWDAILDAVRAIDAGLVAGIESLAPSLRTSSEVGLDPIAVSSSEMPKPRPTDPVAHPRQPSRAMRPSRSLLVGGAVAVLGLIILAGILFTLVFSRAPTATPETLARMLVAPRDTSVPLRLALTPGDYQGPFDFGIAQSRITLHASGPGVRLVAAPGGSGPLIRLQTGLTDFALDGVILVPGERLAIEALSGARASMRQFHIEGGCPRAISISGADIQIDHFSARCTDTAILVENQGTLSITDAVVSSGGIALAVRRGTVTAERVRWSSLGGHAGALVDGDGGTLNMTACIIDAQGCATALRTARMGDVRLVDLALRGARLAWRSDSSAVSRLERLTAEAVDTGIEWLGSRDPAWTWNDILVRASRPVIGLPPVAIDGAGANAQALSAVPVATQRN